MLHEATEMCEGGLDAQLTASLETESSFGSGKYVARSKGFRWMNPGMLAGAYPASIGTPLNRSHSAQFYSPCNVNEIFLLYWLAKSASVQAHSFKGRPRFLTLALANSLTELSQAHTGA